MHQQLFFMDENAPITLQTDASGFGIGGYLFQTLDNMVQVIMCISKALVGAQPLGNETAKINSVKLLI